jgi:hypothetical protein
MFNERLEILSDIQEAATDGMSETMEYEYFESEDDPQMKEFPEFSGKDMKY